MNNNTQLWIVGKAIDVDSSSWGFQGVFDSEDKAKEACISTEHFMGPATLNEYLSDEPQSWPNSRYPKLIL